MNWDAIGAIAELLGAVGVIASLVYLASQIRQNSKLLRSSAASTTTDSVTRISTLMVQDPEVARIFWEGSANRGALSHHSLENCRQHASNTCPLPSTMIR